MFSTNFLNFDDVSFKVKAQNFRGTIYAHRDEQKDVC